MRNRRELSHKLWLSYRDTPVIPSSFTEEQRAAFRGVIGNIASVVHLKETINHHIGAGFNLNSSFMATLRTRLNDAEEALTYYEGSLYGAQARS